MKNDAVGPSIHNINITSRPKEYMIDGMYKDEKKKSYGGVIKYAASL